MGINEKLSFSIGSKLVAIDRKCTGFKFSLMTSMEVDRSQPRPMIAEQLLNSFVDSKGKDERQDVNSKLIMRTVLDY